MSSPQKDLYDAISIVKRKIIPLAFILYFLTIWIVLTSDLPLYA
ncbi:transporter, major facilitator family [Escherichia coli]|nr:transporter, major facilitator family [Escherichia coli]